MGASKSESFEEIILMAMAVVRVLLCVLIVAMDVAAGILAIQAQAAQDKVSKPTATD